MSVTFCRIRCNAADATPFRGNFLGGQDDDNDMVEVAATFSGYSIRKSLRKVTKPHELHTHTYREKVFNPIQKKDATRSQPYILLSQILLQGNQGGNSILIQEIAPSSLLTLFIYILILNHILLPILHTPLNIQSL